MPALTTLCWGSGSDFGAGRSQQQLQVYVYEQGLEDTHDEMSPQVSHGKTPLNVFKRCVTILRATMSARKKLMQASLLTASFQRACVLMTRLTAGVVTTKFCFGLSAASHNHTHT